jgi:hypothetical protein
VGDHAHFDIFCRQAGFCVPYIRNDVNLSPKVLNTTRAIRDIILIIFSILALISIPLLWYGVIEELAKQGRP